MHLPLSTCCSCPSASILNCSLSWLVEHSFQKMSGLLSTTDQPPFNGCTHMPLDLCWITNAGGGGLRVAAQKQVFHWALAYDEQAALATTTPVQYVPACCLHAPLLSDQSGSHAHTSFNMQE